MPARWLIRLDDACPTQNDASWRRIEALLDAHSVRPVVAVVPDNRDPDLICEPARDDFWFRARCWQNKGWAIGLHGWQHRFHTDEPGLVPLNRRSEFAGLSLTAQRNKIRAGYRRLRSEGLSPRIWVAPAHSFDHVTLEALRLETPIRLVSDGVALGPFQDNGFYWIPQQVWRPRDMLFGLWTICLHPNSMREVDFQQFSAWLKRRRARVMATDDIDLPLHGPSFRDRMFRAMFFPAWRFRQLKRSKRIGG
jgi:hypothetical protein